MKFEAAWQDKWNYYARVNDNECIKVIEIPNKFEYYVQNSKGAYKYILDQDITLIKKLGTSKDARDQFGVVNPIYRHIRDNYWLNNYNLSPRIWYLDIEVRADGSFPKPELAEKQITLIQVFDSKLDTMLIFGLRDFEMEPGYELPYAVKYIKCNDEVDLLNKYLQVFKKLDPLIIYAWNGLGFDYPYIYNRLKNLCIDTNLMSNYGYAKCDSKFFENRYEFSFNAYGHYYIDMLDAYKKFKTGNKPSYALDFIANDELGEGKVDHSEFTTFDSFYTGEFYQIADKPYSDKVREEIRQLKIKENNKTLTETDSIRLKKLLQFQFVYYGIKDVYLLKRLDTKINITNIMTSMAQKMGCLLDDTLGTIKPWSSYINNVCYTKGLVFPPRQDYDKSDLKGGFVRDPSQGRHKWVMSFDYNSMYPMNIVGFNMSPETYVPLSKCQSDLRDVVMKHFNSQDEDCVLKYSQDVWDKVTPLLQKYNLSMGINGALFDKSKEGIIPNLVWDIYTQRKKDKKIMLKNERQKEIIQKVILSRKKS